MQQVNPNIRDAFGPVEHAFNPSLFQGLAEGTPGRGFTHLPVKQSDLDLPYHTKTAPDNCIASCVITGNIVAALRGQEEFWTADHSAYL